MTGTKLTSRSLYRISERVLKMAIKCTHKLKRGVHIHNYICNVLKEIAVLARQQKNSVKVSGRFRFKALVLQKYLMHLL